MIYFDHAATSFPKPQEVTDAVIEALTVYGANPGRGGHKLANAAAKKIFETRRELAQFFGLADPNRVIFTQNATAALNQGIFGLSFEQGDHIITTSYEHNSVRRPLERLKREVGVEITYIQPDQNGRINLEDVEKAINARTKLLVATHGSNLTGAIIPIEKLGEICKKHQLTFMVDASQTAGILPIHMTDMNIDLLAFPGHKGLMGPQGTGALLINNKIDLKPLFTGGTGHFSERLEQPEEYPERLESGTLNTPGIAGLLAGLLHIKKVGLEQIFHHEQMLAEECVSRLKKIEGVTVYGPDEGVKRLGVVSFNIDGIDSQEVALILDQHYNIAVRAGLHCSPLAHQSIGSIHTGGAIRASFGIYNTIAEVEQFVCAIEEIRTAYFV
ncbi:aminotransferase class V-fold PLP-dependent enzyme [Calidifontibacillus erzurumensis]|uniref:cysteine desulfurase n=1 Tax=Calidifontibacillus erzurumensis TaxID=2741433 RepID=A0A8J8GF78_9BACI|nr:aminotransferase class V-fold PLP-dependent enzyme [Calidifontibacillus erzurumensis]NSL52364.1 aminotransferase class V-fold PLP-dependent enzyme [Calidifontibacillus erzurumensis]